MPKLAIDKKIERKMRKFIRALGLKIAERNVQQTVAQQYPVFNICNPAESVKTIRRVLKASETPHRYMIGTGRLEGVQRHVFHLDGYGVLSMEVNTNYPKLPQHLSVTNKERP